MKFFENFIGSQRTFDTEVQKQYIIEAAAKFLKSDIKTSISEHFRDHSQSPDKLSVAESVLYLPATLQLLCRAMFVGSGKERKIVSIGQSIVQATQPRVVVPLQLDLSVQMHYQFRSLYLMDTLSGLGFCSSYNEVQMFEHSASVSGACTMNAKVNDESMLMFVAANIDHNLCTLDAKEMYHGMGARLLPLK